MAQVFSQSYFPGDCPEIEVVENFDLQHYLGQWWVFFQIRSLIGKCSVYRYELRTYPVPWRLDGRCTSGLYGQYPNETVSILNTVELAGFPAQLLTSALVIGPGILAISGPSNPYGLNFNFDHLSHQVKKLFPQTNQTTSFLAPITTITQSAIHVVTTGHTLGISLGFFQELDHWLTINTFTLKTFW